MGAEIDREIVLPLVYAGVAEGRALSNVLRDDGMPSHSTFWRWHMEDEAVRDNLARARVNGVEVHMDDMLEISNTPMIGEKRTVKADGGIEIVQADMIEHRKLMIDTRLKRAQMLAPRKYGPKMALTDGDGGPLQIVIRDIAAESK